MRIWLIYICFALAGLSVFLTLIRFSNNPETEIVGEWNEYEWFFEEDTEEDEDPFFHKNEVWSFKPGGILTIVKGGEAREGNWSLKGRGHILQIRYDNNYVESYNIDTLNKDQLVLNFEDDLEVRGISKLLFKRL